MFEHLTQGGLAHVKVGTPLKVALGDFLFLIAGTHWSNGSMIDLLEEGVLQPPQHEFDQEVHGGLLGASWK